MMRQFLIQDFHKSQKSNTIMFNQDFLKNQKPFRSKKSKQRK